MTKNEKVNILLVDDQPAKLLSYEVILSELDENLILAGSAREALGHLLRREIAVVLTDVSMPGLDGFELAAMIREHPRFRRTPIIFISGIHVNDVDLLRGYQAGAVDYVPVPIVPELLRAKVKVFAELYRKTRQLELMNVELERRVSERTAELAKANAMLEKRVEERTHEREAALAQVHEMQKMESIGQLTGGVAHDFNNLLTVVLVNLRLLKKRLPDDPAVTHLIDGAIAGARRGATLTKHLLTFARRQELKPETVELRSLTDGMVEMLRRSIGPDIDVALTFSPDLPPIQVDRNQLELALLNLALNARDAMPEGGRLGIEARRAVVPADLPSVDSGNYVCISVSDTGRGMDEETQKRATEPFYTTKGMGKGTGLGLSMVHGLAAQSGGAMRLRSQVGEGTTVQLWFPVADGRHEHPAVAADLPLMAAPCRVLVVDDDPLITAGLTAMLEDAGHIVVEAPSGERALDVLRLGDGIDLVITDQAMPGMTGLDLARQIRGNWPTLPIILSSGYADLPASEELCLSRLAKPYDETELLALITKVLDAAPDAAFSRRKVPPR